MDEKKSIEERQLVIFKLGQEEFGVNINEVREIIRMEEITKIPNSASYIKGVINLRGGIIVVIDLAQKLGLPSKESDSNTRIIVIEVNESTVGMIVDSATEVKRLSGDNIQDAPSMITKKINSDYIEGVGVEEDRLLILLNLIKVLESEDMAIIKDPPPVDMSKKTEKKEEVKSKNNQDEKSEVIMDVKKAEEEAINELHKIEEGKNPNT